MVVMNRSWTLFVLLVILFSQNAISQTKTSGKAEAPTTGAVSALKDCDVCPELVTVPAGTFFRGSKEGRSTEQPVHQVSVRSFLHGRFEVKQGQWKSVMNSTPSTNQKCGEKCPVESVSWDDVQVYLKKLTELTGKQYRLPSQAEWEYAARAGTTSAYWWGDTATHEQANYGSEECCSGLAEGRDQWENTAPVGQFPPNAFGLHDMQGNVAEWVEDDFTPFVVADLHLQCAGQNEIDIVGSVARVQHHGVPRNMPQHGNAGQGIEGRVIEHLEDRQRPQGRQ